jgi:hypothetical protein
MSIPRPCVLTSENQAKYDAAMRRRKAELPDEIRAMFARWGAEGGSKTAEGRTPKERKAAAVKAIKARWKRYREEKERQAKQQES